MEGQRTMDNDTPIGKRIAFYRKRLGMSQATLAGLVDRTPSWVQKIEYGELAMDSISMLEQLAEVLEVSVWDLKPRFGLPPNGGTAQESAVIVGKLRSALFVPQPDRQVLDLDGLRQASGEVTQLRRAGHYKPAMMLLPDLLTDARASAEQGTHAAWTCLAHACKAALSIVREIGEWELALLIADRFVHAARSSGDAPMIATAARHLGFALLDGAHADLAGAVCSNAADAIAPTDRTSPEGWAAWGSLRLSGAFAANRLKDPTTARRLILEARAAVERLPSTFTDADEGFSVSNVGLHEISIALEAYNPVEALRIADRVDVAELPWDTRRASYCISVAHAQSLRGSDGAAAIVGWLLEAYDYAPDRVRTGVLPRELVRACLRREKRSRTPKLRELAEKIGVAA